MPETTQFVGTGEDGGAGENSLKANTVLFTRYKILGVLGGGGMGTVYQARDLNFPEVRKLVAIKEMQTLTNDPSLRSSTLKTFQREANILATLSHPAIPKIFDFFDQNDRAYLVMEFINGRDLEALLAQTKELPMEKIIEWAIDLCDVLDYLHSHQPEPIIFRDMKPSNVMIDSFGKVRLIDFGIAKTFVSGVKHTMIGTEGYSAPEQYKGDVTPLSDIYSLGATLHHVITRRDPRLEPPFSFNERPIASLNSKTPPDLVNVVERALNSAPHERFSSCAEMKGALEQLRFRPMIAASPGVAVRSGNGNGASSPGTGWIDELDSTGSIQPKWKFTTEDEIRCSPIVYKDLVFIGSYDTNVWAVRLDNGEFVWKYATNGGIASSPIVDENSRLVLFGSEDHSFNALDTRNGRVVWTYTTKDRIRSTARLAHDHVFFGSDDGHIYALHAMNGRRLWAYDTAGPVRGRPFVTNDLIIAGSESGEVVALELSGQRKWSLRTKRGVMASPVVDAEGICYIGSQDTYMYALDASNGYSSWRYRTNGAIISSAYVHNNLVYFGSADGTMYAVNAQTGKDKWKFQIGKPIVSSPIVHRNYLYFGGTDSYFYCLDADSGKERWKFKTGAPVTSAAYITGELILFGCMDKNLYALPLVS
jgi:serine/threonine protein kinase